MVHNGIEYADMQLICEAYSIMKNLLSMTVPQIQAVFDDWNSGELSSYLIEITSDILKKTDPDTDRFLVDLILDVAEQKGTGKWTSKIALDLGVAVPTITQAVHERYLSAIKPQRLQASMILGGPSSAVSKNKEFVDSVQKALYASKICAYAQGFGLMAAASHAYGWNLDLGSIAKIFRGGCIIRAQFLDRIMEAYLREPDLKNLLLDDYFADITKANQNAWRDVVATAVLSGIPVNGFSSALGYYDSYRTKDLPMNLLQAQKRLLWRAAIKG